MQGEGEFWWPDGRHYIGEFVADKKDGKGTMTKPNGDQITGFWKENKFIKPFD